MDLRYSLRTLRQSPGYTLVAVASLALGIGVNTTLFSLMNAMLLEPLPVKHPQQLVEFARQHPDGAIMTNQPAAVYSYLGRSEVTDVFAVAHTQAVLRAGGALERANAQWVSGGFFPVLGVPAAIGRTIGEEDDRAGAGRVVVLSHSFWTRRFARDASILGTTVRIGDEPCTIVGVMPASFVGVDRSRVPDFWMPFAGAMERSQPWVLGRLRPRVTAAQAQAALAPLFHSALESLRDQMRNAPEHDRTAFLAQRLLVQSAANGTAELRWSYWEYSSTLKVLLGLTGVILLSACANLANLLMARAVTRSREMAIRLAMGAGRWRLIRQMLSESLLLSLAGGGLGLLLAAGGHGQLLAFLMRDPGVAALDFQLDGRVLLFSLAASVVTATLFGLTPAIRATRVDVAGSIYGDVRGGLSARVPLAKAMLAVQVGLSLVLLAGAGLFTRSLRNLGAVELGLSRSENLLLMDVRSKSWERVRERVMDVPGVKSVAAGGDAVFGRGGWNQTVWVQRPGQAAQDLRVSTNAVDAGFFSTVGIPVMAGREFRVEDRETAPPVAVVNRTFARRAFGDENVVGRRFGANGTASVSQFEIVGVVGDAKYGSVREVTRPMVFYPMAQSSAAQRDARVLHVRTEAQAAAIQRAIVAADPEALVGEAKTVPQVVHSELRQDRMFATLGSLFALLALGLAAMGIYGVVSFGVARRRAEIGVRIALGAQRGDVVWLILRETLMVLAGGTLIGVPAALAAASVMRSLLFGVTASDPLTIAGAWVALVAAGVAAALLPARRAAATEPMSALRAQ